VTGPVETVYYST